jgi:hypothetical protein
MHTYAHSAAATREKDAYEGFLQKDFCMLAVAEDSKMLILEHSAHIILRCIAELL